MRKNKCAPFSVNLKKIGCVTVLALPLLLMLFLIVAIFIGSQANKEIEAEQARRAANPIAVYTPLGKTEEYPKGVHKYEYPHGVFMVPENLVGGGGVPKTDSLTIDLRFAWPEFGDKVDYKQAEAIDRVWMLMHVSRKDTWFQDIYPALEASKDIGRLEADDFDYSYPALKGFKVTGDSFYSYYEASITTPMGTPLVIQCFRSRSEIIGEASMNCRYHLIMDSLLHIRISFHRPMLEHFPDLHHQVMERIYSIWRSK